MTTTASGPSSFWTMRAPRKFAPERDPHAEPELGGQLLGHEDGVAVVDGDDLVERVQLDDGRDELVGDALDAVLPDLVPGGHRRRVGGLEGVELDRRASSGAGSGPTPMIVPPVPTPATKASGRRPVEAELPPDLGPGRLGSGRRRCPRWRTAAAGRRPASRPQTPPTA